MSSSVMKLPASVWELERDRLLTPSTRMECDLMIAKKPNRHEQKTRETREQLLLAAETVFVRDGYEKADLLEIAKLAGRTKGAIYAQFKSKEEVFLALVEKHALQRRALMRERLAESSTVEGNLAALRAYYVGLAEDDVFGMLMLEFRLYTIRHPDVRERLAELYRSLLPENEEAAYTAMLGSAGSGEDAIPRATAVHTAFMMQFALQVQMKFEPEVFQSTSPKVIAGRIFDSLFELPK